MLVILVFVPLTKAQMDATVKRLYHVGALSNLNHNKGRQTTFGELVQQLRQTYSMIHGSEEELNAALAELIERWRPKDPKKQNDQPNQRSILNSYFITLQLARADEAVWPLLSKLLNGKGCTNLKFVPPSSQANLAGLPSLPIDDQVQLLTRQVVDGKWVRMNEFAKLVTNFKTTALLKAKVVEMANTKVLPALEADPARKMPAVLDSFEQLKKLARDPQKFEQDCIYIHQSITQGKVRAFETVLVQTATLQSICTLIRAQLQKVSF